LSLASGLNADIKDACFFSSGTFLSISLAITEASFLEALDYLCMLLLLLDYR
jgi:hypothetical protein